MGDEYYDKFRNEDIIINDLISELVSGDFFSERTQSLASNIVVPATTAEASTS
jgi:hypothetical protein